MSRPSSFCRLVVELCGEDTSPTLLVSRLVARIIGPDGLSDFPRRRTPQDDAEVHTPTLNLSVNPDLITSGSCLGDEAGEVGSQCVRTEHADDYLASEADLDRGRA
jgi:hypothetical protein